MLQTPFARSPGTAEGPSTEMTPFEVLSYVRTLIVRHYPLIIFVQLCVIFLIGVYLLTASRYYTATAEVIIDSRKNQIVQQQNAPSADQPIDTFMVDSQVEILKSEAISLSVIKELGLINEPEFTGPSGGLIGSVSEAIGSFFPSSPLSDYERQRIALARFEKALAIKRRNLTYVIEVSFKSLSPEKAAQIANAVADAYLVDTLESKYQASRRAAVWLQDRLKELRSQASDAQRAVADFKAKNNIVDAGGRLLSEQQLAEVNSTLTIARTQRAEAQARVERITSILKNENQEPNALLNDIATVADTLRNDVITRLRQQYLDLAARESDWSNRYGQTHLAVVNLRNQMREIQRSITDELRRIGETYKSDLEIAKSREELAQKNLNDAIAQSNDTSQAQIVLRDLESNAQSSRALADNFLQLYMLSVQQQSFPITEARVITEAAMPLKPSSPKTMILIALAIVGGAGLGFAAAFLRDIMDRVIRTAPQVEKLLGASCLALIPMVTENELSLEQASGATDRKRRLALPQILKRAITKPQTTRNSLRFGEAEVESSAASVAARQLKQPLDVANVVINSPFSRFAEAVRAIKMAADLNGFDTPSTVLGITSSMPNEGKSTISEALAFTCAQSGARTLLVDGDVRNPTLTAHLSPEAKAGLVELVLGQAELKDVIWTDPTTNLHFLPCVLASRVSTSADLLSSSQMEKLFRQLREQYDRIILDLSPMAPVIDVRGTSRLVDSYVLVIEWAKTKIEIVERAVNETPALRQRMLGVVLNKVDVTRMGRYDSLNGDYYNNKYYARYGYIN